MTHDKRQNKTQNRKSRGLSELRNTSLRSDRLSRALQLNEALQVTVNILRGKAIPLQAWTGPEGSRSLRFQDFKTIGT